MRALATLAFVVGCSSSGPAEEPVDPKGWTITVDMSGLDRFVVPETEPSWPVIGQASATGGLVGVDVAGAPVAFGSDGAFATSVPTMPGLVPVPVLARDAAGHERKGDRTLLAARLLPDGAHNRDAAALVLDDAILAALGADLATTTGTIDIAGEILGRPILSQDDRCVTWPVAASQREVEVELVQDAGVLWLHVQIPDLYVYFEGECQGPLRLIPLAGELGGTVDVWTRLTGKPGGDCLTAFAHTTPEVYVNAWGFDVWGLGGPLQNWIISLFENEKAAEARTQIATEVKTRADALLDDKLENITVFDRVSELPLLGKPVAMHLCLAALDRVGNTLVARIAAHAASASEAPRSAPGVPQIDGAMPRLASNELVLDANLVGQLLFASWRAGGLARTAPDADISVLQILVPELVQRFPDATHAQITIDAELPPLVRATPDATGDVTVELGDLMLDLSIDGQRIFRFGVNLTLALDLVPTNGALVPTVVGVTSTVALLDELYDGPDAALEQGVALQIADTATQLLDGAAAIALPDLPGLGKPTSVAADRSGRFLHITLAP
jgi:hypothetical protein